MAATWLCSEEARNVTLTRNVEGNFGFPSFLATSHHLHHCSLCFGVYPPCLPRWDQIEEIVVRGPSVFFSCCGVVYDGCDSFTLGEVPYEQYFVRSSPRNCLPKYICTPCLGTNIMAPLECEDFEWERFDEEAYRVIPWHTMVVWNGMHNNLQHLPLRIVFTYIKP